MQRILIVAALVGVLNAAAATGPGDKWWPDFGANAANSHFVESEQITKSNGFSSLDEFDSVNANIALVLSGLDPKTGQFTEPPEVIKKDIEDLKQDKQMAQKDKDEALAEMQEALKSAKPLQFKENIALVKKYQNDLEALTQKETTK